MKFINWFSDGLKKLSGVCLIGMMLLTCADVITSFFGHPILGSEELTALSASILLGFALPASHIDKAHVGVELLYLKLSRSRKKINDIFVAAVSLLLFLLMTWQCYLYGEELRATGEVSMTLQFPTYILVYCISFALLVLSLVMLSELVGAFWKGGSHE